MKKYYLYKYYVNEKLVYIGKTKRPYKRYVEHLKKDEKFYNVNFIEVAEVNQEIKMDVLELFLINNEKPIWNKVVSSGDKIEVHLEFIKYDIKNFILTFSGYKNPLPKTYELEINRKNLHQKEPFKSKFYFKRVFYSDDKALINKPLPILLQTLSHSQYLFYETKYGWMSLTSSIDPSYIPLLFEHFENPNKILPSEIFEDDFEVDVAIILDKDRIISYYELIPIIIYKDEKLHFNVNFLNQK